MKHVIAICLLLATGAATAAEKTPDRPATKRSQDAVAGLSQKLNLDFSIPFPKEYLDIDDYMIQPISKLATPKGELFCTKPCITPQKSYDTIEWLVGQPDARQFSREYVDCFFSFDDFGGIVTIGITSKDDWYRGGENENHQLLRLDDERPDVFLSRIFRVYGRRVAKCSNPSMAAAYLAGIEQFVRAICELRRSEEVPSYPATARQ